MSSAELFALLDRAQSGDEAACEQVLTEKFRSMADVMERVLAQFTDEELETMLRLHVRFTTAVSQAIDEIRQKS